MSLFPHVDACLNSFESHTATRIFALFTASLPSSPGNRMLDLTEVTLPAAPPLAVGEAKR
jgi:hypothetical protein